MTPQIWLISNPNKPTHRRLSFKNDMTTFERGLGWVAELVNGGVVALPVREAVFFSREAMAAHSDGTAKQEQSEPVACLVGTRGSAFDSPKTKRAYTYTEQPNNIVAYKLGKACAAASSNLGGDAIDAGLSLLKELQAEGFGVFDLGAEYTTPQQRKPLKEWVSVDDRLPEPYTEVLVTMRYGDGDLQVRTSEHDPDFEENKGWCFGSCFEAVVTHWMPMPEAAHGIKE